jgi:uncharacterized protein DUF3108
VRILSVLGVVALIVAMPAPRSTAQGDKTEYMPLKVGSKWTYKVEFGGQNLTIPQKCTKIEKKGEHEVASLEMEVMGMTVTEQLSSNAKGVFRHSFNGVPVEPPIQALKLPIKKGETWEAEIEIMGQKVKATMKSDGEEEVTVPAGKYKAVAVGMEIAVMGQQVKAKNWFAPNVGIVKQTFDIGGFGGTSELEKVELAK